MFNSDAILEKTLRLTESNWGTAQVMDFSKVTGEPTCPGNPTVEVTDERVQDAVLRFRGRKVTILNFASGVSPGGAVRWGSIAQEESICLCSGLLHGLEGIPEYYEANQAPDAPQECYDRMIWSEDVPLVRDGHHRLVEPMLMNVITYPAPNVAFRDATNEKDVFRRRCRHVVRQASKTGTDVLVLGAWGCGEYGNDPWVVAPLFKDALASQSGSIQHVVFACYGPAVNRDTFKQVFVK